MSVSDRRVSYGFLTSRTIGLIFRFRVSATQARDNKPFDFNSFTENSQSCLTVLLCDNSNSLMTGAKSNTFTWKLCDCISQSNKIQ